MKVVVGLVALLMATTWAGAPAAATMVENFRFTQDYDDERWDCGYPMRVQGVESHVIHVRLDKKLDGVAYVTDNYAFEETWATADGRSFGLIANGVAKDMKGRRIAGPVYEFTFQDTGQPLVITDASGAVLYRDRGAFKFHYSIDLDTGAFEFLGLSLAGPHPLFDVDVCKAVAPITGTESADYLTPRPIGSTESSMGYYEYLPPSYSTAGDASPVLVALNGYGETGDGTPEALERLLFAGIPRFIDIGGWPTDRTLVVLAPQHVEDPPGFPFGEECTDPGGGSCNMFIQHDRDHASPAFCTTPDEVHDFLAFAVGHYNVDPARVYVTGLSCGAFGLWEYLAKYGDEAIAAAVPIAGEGRPALATAGCALGDVPIWAFHGEFDDVVDPEGSIVPIEALQACGVPDAELTVYPDLFHDGWDQAYSGSLGDDIYSWMLGFSNP